MRLLALCVCAWLALAAIPVLAQGPASPPPPAASSAPALPKSLPLKRDEAAADAPYWQLPALLLVLIAAGGGALAWGRNRSGPWQVLRTGSSSRAPIVVLARQPLTAQASVHAVRWAGEDLLLSCSGQQVAVIARRPAPAEGDAA